MSIGTNIHRRRPAPLTVPVWRLIVCATLAWAPIYAAHGQDASKQLWGNYIIALPKSDRLYMQYDFQGGATVSGDDDTSFVSATGKVEYFPNRFLDLTGELVTDFTEQADEPNYFEGAVRVGFRFHVINQIVRNPIFKGIRRERVSAKRFSFSNLARIEFRKFWYGDDTPPSSNTRFRDRIAFKLAINRPSLASDGVWYALADAEWFVSLDNEQEGQRLPSKLRYRAGVGYRSSYTWRFEVLAIKDVAYDTNGMTNPDTYALDLRVKRYF